MSKLLVTGGAGFIGTNFVRYWRNAHPDDEIMVLDALTYAGRRENLAGLDGVTFVHGNICDEALVEQAPARSRHRYACAFRRRKPCRSVDRGTGRLHRNQYCRHAQLC